MCRTPHAFSRLVAIFFALAFSLALVISGCSSGSGDGSTDQPPVTDDDNGGGDGDDSQAESPGELEDPVYVEDGVTGGTFTTQDGDFSVTIQADSMPAALRASPTVAESAIAESLLTSSTETLVSDLYEIDLGDNVIDAFITTSSVPVTIAIDLSGVPAIDQDSLHVYAKAYIPEDDVLLPVRGTIDNNVYEMMLTGLPDHAVFGVVYNSAMRAVVSDSIQPSGYFAQATQLPPWETNTFTAFYDPFDSALRDSAADILGVSDDDLTEAQIDGVVKEKVTDNAAAAGAIYQEAGYRQPNLAVYSDDIFSTGSSMSFGIEVTSRGNSFAYGTTYTNGFTFGTLYVNNASLNRSRADSLGSVRAAIAHEMFHAIQNGYGLGYGSSLKGAKEGSATTYGVTIDADAAEAQVRSVNISETMRLSNYLMRPKHRWSEAYANQDFYAWVSRVYNPFYGLVWIATYMENLKVAIDNDVALGNTKSRIGPPFKTVWSTLDAALEEEFGESLSTVYFEFVKDRAMEHPVVSQLRPFDMDEFGLDESLFHTSGAIFRKNVDPGDLATTPLEGSIANITQFATRVLVITPIDTVNNGADVALTLDLDSGTLGETARVALYRGGEAVEITGPYMIEDFGESLSDVLTLLIANTDENSAHTINYSLQGGDFMIADVVIDGTNYPYQPQLVVGALGTFSGSVERSGLPGIYSSEGTSFTDLMQDMIIMISDPQAITGPGTYTVNEPDVVFEDHLAQTSITYHTPSIINVDDRDPVIFGAITGTITYTEYGTRIGDRLSGTFSVSISGDQTLDEEGETQRTLTGTMTGSFSAEIQDE